MSLLAPLFMLGALAISLPILLHLIRRTPRGKMPFSSLMFLSPSPPRITRRSRIEHWLLLLLRAAAIGLLAFAFSRPFFRETANLMLNSVPGQRLAIVVDTSASMRREDLWRQALARVERLISNTGPADDVALFVYDDTVRLLVDWDEQFSDQTARRARLRNALADVRPTWGSSDLGQALVTAADYLAVAASERRDGRASTLVVITDLQRGSNTAALQAYEWPVEIMAQVETVRPSSQDNAGIRLLEGDEQPGWRVRVANAMGSTSEQFRVGWADATSAGPDSETINLYVPAAQSRVVRLGAPPPSADRVQLVGDIQGYDNTFYFAPVRKREIQIVFVGRDEPDDPHGLRYFLERVWSDTSQRKVTISALAPDRTLDPPADSATTTRPQLVVVASPLPEATVASVRNYVRGGGTAMIVAADAETSAALVHLADGISTLAGHQPADVTSTASTAKSNVFALLSDIDFSHPVFAPFAGPRYNDFTKVRIWKHQRFSIDGSAQARMLARFDNGDPAIWEQPLGSGKLLCLACGWRPADSQLALSSKFVPILSLALDHLTGVQQGRSGGWRIGQTIPLPFAAVGGNGIVVKPDGQSVAVADGVDQFRDADQPGIYHYQRGLESADFAVNLDPAESDTAALGADQLEQLGVRMGRRPTQAEQLERQRQMRDTELESRQKLWRWLLVGVLGVLALETLFAGRLARHESRETTS